MVYSVFKSVTSFQHILISDTHWEDEQSRRDIFKFEEKIEFESPVSLNPKY